MIPGIDCVQTKCHRCHTEFVLPNSLYDAAKRSEKVSFFCPYGHEAIFPAGETEEQKLRRERDVLAQRIAQKDDRIKSLVESRDRLDRRLSATRGVVTKIKNRVGGGVCPCCNRTFSALAHHMKTKHPEFRAEAV